MEEKGILFDYFYETQAEQFTFYKIPKNLFTDNKLQSLSSDAKILYGLMLNRVSLSIKNHWMDKKGRVYIIFTLEEVMKAIRCGKEKGVKILNELEQKAGLIERVKQGFGKPTLIYLKSFISRKEEFSDYFYEAQTEQFTFYRIPKILFTDNRFQCLSSDVKILYGLLLDRMSLSIKNRWIDKKGRVYITFTLEQVMKSINCGKEKGVKILNELEQKVGLIERVKQGFGKPTLIYVKNFISREEEKTSDFPKSVEQGEMKEEIELKKQQENLLEYKKDTHSFPAIIEDGKAEVMTSENQKYQGRKNRSIKVGFSDPNNTNYITKTNNSNTNLIYLSKKEKEELEKEDKIDEIRRYQELIKKNIEYPLLLQNNPYRQKEIEELVFLILEVVCGKRDTIWIAGAMQPIQLVKSQFLKLNVEHMQYVLDCLHKNPVHVRNIKAYLLTTLFNAPNTLNQYYRAMVNYDMHFS